MEQGNRAAEIVRPVWGSGNRVHVSAAEQVSIHGVPWDWCQLTAGSGGSQGFPSMAVRMASGAGMPWAAAESR